MSLEHSRFLLFANAVFACMILNYIFVIIFPITVLGYLYLAFNLVEGTVTDLNSYEFDRYFTIILQIKKSRFITHAT